MTSLIRSGSSARIFSASYCVAAFMLALLPQSRPVDHDNRCYFKTVNQQPAYRCAAEISLLSSSRMSNRNCLDGCVFKTNYGDNACEKGTAQRSVGLPHKSKGPADEDRDD